MEKEKEEFPLVVPFVHEHLPLVVPFVHEHLPTCAEVAFEHEGILDVLLTLNNYRQYHSRYRLFKKFVEGISSQPRIRIHVVEIALGDRKFFINQDDPSFYTVLRLRTTQEIWHKENSLNLLAARLPLNAKYLAWIDADISFLNNNWVSDTLNALQHYDVCQIFQSAIDLGPKGEVIGVNQSFGWSYHKRDFDIKGHINYNGEGHTGYAWACTKTFFNKIGGLFPYAVLGAGDNHMAHAFVGLAALSYNKNTTDGYKNKILQYQKRCTGVKLGYVEGTIYHSFHGKKKDRHYWDRWLILVNNKFSPEEHLCTDYQGLFYFVENEETYNLIRDVAKYFAIRNEDSIDLE